jgi:hypothetical protein
MPIPHLLLPHAPIRQQQFEISDRPHYHPCPRRQPTMNLSLNIFEDLAEDLMKLHSWLELHDCCDKVSSFLFKSLEWF